MINKKHIAVVCNYELKRDRIGGMDRFFIAYNEILIKKGHKLTWFFSTGEKFDFYSGFELHFAGKLNTVESFTIDFLKKKNVDIVVTHFLALCTSFYKDLRRNNQPYIIAVDHNPRPFQGFSIKKKIKNKLKGKFYSRYIDCFVGVSKYTVSSILQDYGSNLGKKTKVVYNGIDTSVYLKRTEENQGKFIVASHLRKSKGIQDLIEAVGSLNESIRNNLKIDIFGEGPLEADLKDMITKYSLHEQFSFKGSSSQLPELFQNYSFMLQPTYMECFSLSILESLAANVPVITTPVGGNPEIITRGENGFLFNTGDIQQLAVILEKVLQGDLKIENDVSSYIEKEFSLNKMVEDHVNLLPCT